MIVYRIANKQYINDLSGEGARLYGGRWNLVGTPCLYTAQNAALALLEFIVQYNRMALPRNLYLAKIEIPETFKIKTLDTEDLPIGWDKAMTLLTTQKMGNQLFSSTAVGGFKIPSVVAPYEHNFVFNPLYAGFNKLKVLSIQAFKIDERL